MISAEGIYSLEDGSLWQAAKQTVKSEVWASFNKAKVFDGKSLVSLMQVQSSKKDHARVVRRRVSNGVIQHRLYAEEALNSQGVQSESEVGVLNFAKSESSTIKTYHASTTQEWLSITIPEAGVYNSTFFTDMLSFAGGDTAYAAAHTESGTSIKVAAMEEQSKDEELKHAKEDINVLYFSKSTSGVLKGEILSR